MTFTSVDEKTGSLVGLAWQSLLASFRFVVTMIFALLDIFCNASTSLGYFTLNVPLMDILLSVC